MSAALIARIRSTIENWLGSLGIDPPVAVNLEVPPRSDLGDLACPVAFELARRLKRPPKEIAGEIGTLIEGIGGIARVEIAGGGYLNIYFDRDLFLRHLAGEIGRPWPRSGAGKRIVEHTNINPNKAAHIGHLRNAVLGDALVRCLEFLGEDVEVQNYIDDTGVQVADLAVGFHEIRRLTVDEIRKLAHQCSLLEGWNADTRHFVPSDGRGRFEVRTAERFAAGHAFDHYCWDLYAEVGPFYAASVENAAKRGEALKQMEERCGPHADAAAFLSRQMVLHHLRTMRWIGVRYDLLPRESDILALGFWERAFTLLRDSGAIRFATEGKATGCWVMDLPDSADAEDEGAKIIVRSNGTVTYVGKDIAYQMWKLGLLGSDFQYQRLDPAELDATDHRAGRSSTNAIFSKVFETGDPVWMTSHDTGESEHPPFGAAARVYNVIDVRQSYLQKVVTQGLKALGHEREATESIHFAYEMVALTPKSVAYLNEFLGHGIPLTDEEKAKPYIEMAGRRGIGVKAEELLEALANTVTERIERERSEEIPKGEMRDRIAVQIAVGALRYYMLRFTKNRVIAFDFEDAVAFEGETGPYLQYAAVRSANIFNKLRERDGFERANVDALFETAQFSCLDPPDALEHWQIARDMSRLPEIVEQAVVSLELSLLARYVFSVAQRFSAFYHRYPILHEPDPQRRHLRIALNELFLRFMERSFQLMGVPMPERM